MTAHLAFQRRARAMLTLVSAHLEFQISNFKSGEPWATH